MRRSRVVLVLAVSAFLVPAAPASAVDCGSVALTDAEGLTWTSSSRLDGRADGGAGYQNLMSPYFARDGMQYVVDSQRMDECTLEDGGRELRHPVVRIGDLDVSGTWYVPSGAPAFQRSMLILHNPNDVPAALPPTFDAATEWSGQTDVVTSSDGNGEGSAADDWIVLENGSDAADPRVAFVWNLGSGDRRRSAVEAYEADDRFDTPPGVFADGDNELQVRWDRVVVPPGGTATLLMVGLTRVGAAAAEDAARQLQGAPEALLAGLSDDEKRALQNVGLPDRDLDGVANGADSCPDVVNPDQANLDGDGQGDACDEDLDGDGLPNLAETARGTDPRNADSDGDGRRDDADACPTKAGRGGDGCAAFDADPPVPDTQAPGVTIRQLGARMKLRAFRRGVPCVVDVTEAAAVVCRLLVRARRVARIAAAGDLELASRSLPIAAGRRSVRLKPRRSLIRQRRFRATLQVTAVDAAGNRRVATKRFRVR